MPTSTRAVLVVRINARVRKNAMKTLKNVFAVIQRLFRSIYLKAICCPILPA